MITIDSRVRRQWQIEALFGALAGAAVLAIVLLLLPLSGVWRAVIFVAGSAIISITPQALVAVRYRYWRYGLADDALILEYGVWTRRRSMTPYFRVQNVDVSQGPLERRLGLKRLTIRTASASTDASIPGLDSVEAEQLRILILDRAGQDAAV